MHVLCCVVHSHLVIEQIEVTCLFHCLSNTHQRYAKLYVLYIKNHFLCFMLLNHNRHMSFTMKYFIDKIQGHWQNNGVVGRHRPSKDCHPCMPCGWNTSWWGSHPSSSSSSSCHLRSHLSPCGTCGSGTSLIHCSVVMSVRQVGCWIPGSLQQEPWSPSWGWPW